MPNLAHLLAEAAELAPEWCEKFEGPNLDRGYHINPSDDYGVFLYEGDEIDDPDRALILFAVLKECERRGIEANLRSYTTLNGERMYLLELGDLTQDIISGDLTNDPAEASLSAFVSLLRLSREEVG